MIELNDQEELFKLISRKIKKDVSCYAFGGTAMMYYGYKNATKDIDLLFLNDLELNEFIKVLKDIGYKEISPNIIYPIDRLDKPKMFKLDDERFDIFNKNVFNFKPSKAFKERFFARYDYREGEFTFTVYVVSKEDIILMKALTERENDFSDILTILDKEKAISWDIITNEALIQENDWVKIDLEQTLQKLKKHVFIKKKYFDKLYGK